MRLRHHSYRCRPSSGRWGRAPPHAAMTQGQQPPRQLRPPARAQNHCDGAQCRGNGTAGNSSSTAIKVAPRSPLQRLVVVPAASGVFKPPRQLVDKHGKSLPAAGRTGARTKTGCQTRLPWHGRAELPQQGRGASKTPAESARAEFKHGAHDALARFPADPGAVSAGRLVRTGAAGVEDAAAIGLLRRMWRARGFRWAAARWHLQHHRCWAEPFALLGPRASLLWPERQPPASRRERGSGPPWTPLAAGAQAELRSARGRRAATLQTLQQVVGGAVGAAGAAAGAP